MELFTVPDGEDEEETPEWVDIDIAEMGVLSRATWERLYELIDEKCKAEDIERRRVATG